MITHSLSNSFFGEHKDLFLLKKKKVEVDEEVKKKIKQI